MFDLFYRRYVAECEAFGVVPLPPDHLLALIGALVEQTIRQRRETLRAVIQCLTTGDVNR